MDQKGFREIHGSPFAAAELIEIFFRELVRALDLFSSSTPHFDSWSNNEVLWVHLFLVRRDLHDCELGIFYA